MGDSKVLLVTCFLLGVFGSNSQRVVSRYLFRVGCM